jgi:hypothetical protein
VDLHVESTVAGLPWEAFVAAAARAAGEPPEIGWNMMRLSLGRGVPRAVNPTDRSPRSKGACLVAATGLQIAAARAWARSGIAFETAEDISELSAWQTVHIIARAVTSSAGPVLDLLAAQGAVVRPERLPVRDACVVLQGEPLDGTTRSDTERMQAAELRVIATALVDVNVGAKLVIVIPPLSPELAEAAMDTIARSFSDSGNPGREHLLAAITELRSLIAGDPAAAPLSADRLELATDVCIVT